MKTIEVKFQGKEYKIRNNMRTKFLYEQEIKKLGGYDEVGQFGGAMVFAYCALKGYNKFNGTLDEVMMYIDDEENESLVKGLESLFISEEVESDKDEDEKK